MFSPTQSAENQREHQSREKPAGQLPVATKESFLGITYRSIDSLTIC
jgi:hypothetical protein